MAESQPPESNVQLLVDPVEPVVNPPVVNPLVVNPPVVNPPDGDQGATTECRATSDHLFYMCQNLFKNEA